MDSHDNEPSYYEVALTNRQVVAGFVILLACLFAAFLSGVWLGRGSGAAAPGPALASIERAPEAGEAKLEQLTFFGERAGGAVGSNARPVSPAPPAKSPAATSPPPAAAPAERAAPTPAELEAERLRKTLEAEMERNRAEPVEEAPAASPPAAAPPGTRLRRAPETAPAPATATTQPAAAATTPAPAPPAAASAATWIQVYSSTNGGNAQGLAARLRRGGFGVVVLEAPGGASVTYRVRVGPYGTRAAADAAAVRLRREYRLDTWVTDQP